MRIPRIQGFILQAQRACPLRGKIRLQTIFRNDSNIIPRVFVAKNDYLGK